MTKIVPTMWHETTHLAWLARLEIGQAGDDLDEMYHEAASFYGVLFLDDIGAVKYAAASGAPTHAHDGIAFLLRRRYEALLPTILTSHQSLSQLADRIGIGIASRLRQMTRVELTGQDRRR